ncbi:3-beta hydroxysteroid dehydrogenase/isomerase family-domain-containing protein [Mycena leptocephala]|nr:3-beta hydroxysteroid dehydrogenase/isomerase family-domain-containing protein [Mycena leptocephala]
MSAHSAPAQESYLVIGGGTTVGESIVAQLLRRGETRVSIFDAEPLAADQVKRFGDAVRVVVGDISVPQDIADAVKSKWWADLQRAAQELYRKVNTDGMRNTLAAALENSSVTQLVYVGNAGIFFDGTDRPMLREAGAPFPEKCYDEALEPQAHAERMVLSFNGVNMLRTAVIRPAMVFGPGIATTDILRKIHADPQLTAYQIGNNTNLVDMTYVANLAHAAILAADRLLPSHPKHAATAGKAFFITDASPRPFWDFQRNLLKAAGGVPPAPVVADLGAVFLVAGVKDMLGRLWGGEKMDAWKQAAFMCTTRTFDISLAREVLGYEPIVSHDEGIRRIAELWLQQEVEICKEKKPRDDRGDAKVLTEKSPFF